MKLDERDVGVEASLELGRALGRALLRESGGLDRDLVESGDERRAGEVGVGVLASHGGALR